MAEKNCKNCKWGTLSAYGHTVYECFCKPERVFKSLHAHTPTCQLWEPQRNYIEIPDGKITSILPLRSIVDLTIERDNEGNFESMTVCTCSKTDILITNIEDAELILIYFDLDYTL